IAIRRASATVMRENMAAGINGRKTINRETMVEVRKIIGDTTDKIAISAGGRRWKPETYVDMVTRTKMAEAHRESTANEAVQRGVFYGVISRHGATDACSRWEGRIVKLTMEAPGDYPYFLDLPRREIFHPNCRHVITPIRNPESLQQ
ncbi:phage minor capsid protein, partial [Paenibacillus pinihumi]|uniref:phage minor capsid protein n=1 Tax=Paenibacillus pinihumi TaxID=669462 RepID=UPI00048B387E